MGEDRRRRARLAAGLAAGALSIATAAPAGADHGNGNLPWPELLPPREVGTEVQPAPMPACPHARVACVQRVVERMTRRWRPLDRSCDHRAVFALTYLRTTEALRDTLRRNPAFFRYTRWVLLEDVLFANYYFRAYDNYEAGRQVPDAWRIAFDTATRDPADANAGQDVLLGMNAHIQRDLPYVLAEVGLRTPGGVSRKPDHDRVNRILTRVVDPVEDEIARRYDEFFTLADLKPSPMEEHLALELLKSWREGAWRNAERLLSATSAQERRTVRASIEAGSRAWAEALSAGEVPGYGAVRDAHCGARFD